jgi:hypothetical protein
MTTIRRLILTVLLTLCTLPVAAQTRAQMTAAIARVNRSTVILWMPLADGYCTGFVVAPDQVLTAAHCVTNAGGAIAIGPDGDEWAQGAVLDMPGDMALLVVHTKGRPSVVFRHTPLKDNATVYALGYGFGYSRPVSTINTVLWQHYGPDDKAVGLFVRGELAKGMSGGPMFDSVGRVIGLAQQSYQSVSYGADTPHIEAFLREARATLAKRAE